MWHCSHCVEKPTEACGGTPPPMLAVAWYAGRWQAPHSVGTLMKLRCPCASGAWQLWQSAMRCAPVSAKRVV